MIDYAWTMIIDIDPPALNVLTIDGDLKFNNNGS